MDTTTNLEPGRWLTREDFRRVSGADIRAAARSLSAGRATHPVGKSTDYNVVLEDGTRLAPKAVFGLAARTALGVDVRPKHFRGGAGPPCFRAIAAAGFGIEPKRGRGVIPADPGDEWAEGEPRRVSHLSYERSRRAAREKKQAYRDKHGHLACEKCGFIPVKKYGAESGEACIEVHHTIPLASLGKTRKTRPEAKRNAGRSRSEAGAAATV